MDINEERQCMEIVQGRYEVGMYVGIYNVNK